MTQITPFPFNALPAYSADEIHLRRRLLDVYQFLESQKDLLGTMTQPFTDLIGEGVKIRLDRFDHARFENFSATLNPKSLVGVVRAEPRALRIFLVMDTALAQLVSGCVIAGSQITPDTFAGLEIRPITALQEAVVEYVLVGLLETVSQKVGKKNFELRYDSVITDSAALQSLAKPTDEYAVFSLRVSFQGRDFFCKVLVPVPLCDEFFLSQHAAQYEAARLPSFLGLGVDLELIAGEVTLEPSDLAGLAAGDIVLLDKSRLAKKDGSWTGLVQLAIDGSEASSGWWMDLVPGQASITAKVEGQN